jgi:hypothetical protein
MFIKRTTAVAPRCIAASFSRLVNLFLPKRVSIFLYLFNLNFSDGDNVTMPFNTLWAISLNAFN